MIDRLAKRYAGHSALYGIELLNEPISEEMLKTVGPRYQPRHPEQAQGSEAVPTDLLKEFYKKGYETVRNYCSPETMVVLHDQFMLEMWEDFMPPSEYPGVVIDTHMYIGMEEAKLEDRRLAAYDRKAPDLSRTPWGDSSPGLPWLILRTLRSGSRG